MIKCDACDHDELEHSNDGLHCKHLGYNPSTHESVPCRCRMFVRKIKAPSSPAPTDAVPVLKDLVKAFFDAEAEWDALNIVKDNKQLVRDTAIKLDRARTALLKAAGLEP